MRRVVFYQFNLYGKQAVILFLACVLLLTGCGSSFSSGSERQSQTVHIVCTTFPQYDWVRNLIDGNEGQFELSLLMQDGGDLHNFQPSALDIARVSDCDLFIYVGGESDAWVEDVLRETVNTDMRIINMMDRIGARLKEEASDSHDHHAHHDHDVPSYDEHVWLSLRNAEILVEEIAAELTAMDQANADIYRENCNRYLDELETLDNDYCAAVASGTTNTLLFADRFPFRYMVEDYGLAYFAAFEGCSAETEASFETIAFLSGKLDELGLDTVLVIDSSDQRLAEVIIGNTSDKNRHILALNSMQSVLKKDIEGGMTYLSIMQYNLEILKQALAENSKKP